MADWGDPWGLGWGAGGIGITAASAQSVTTVLVTFSGGAFAPSSVNSGDQWTVVPTNAYATAPVVLTAAPQAGNTEVLLTVAPGLSGGEEYTVTALEATDTGGDPAVPNSETFTVSAAFVLADPDFPIGVLAAILDAMGRQIHRLIGRPATRLVQAVGNSNTRLVVESTLGFPESGTVIDEDGVRWTYTSKTDASFEGAVPLSYVTGQAFGLRPAGGLVVLDETSTPVS